MAPFHRQLKVLRVVVAAAYDNEVFETTGNKQLAIF